MSMLHQLALVVAPWADFYNDSKVAQTAVTFGHFGGMMTAGGFALGADRATLRAVQAEAPDRQRHLQELSSIHPIVVGALAVTALISKRWPSLPTSGSRSRWWDSCCSTGW
jgi:hypothetical protein